MKVLILIKCVLIGLCSSQRPGAHWREKISLISSSNKLHNYFNQMFMESMKDIVWPVVEVPVEKNGISSTINEMQINPIVINLGVPAETDTDARVMEIIEFHNSDLMCIKNCDFLTTAETDAFYVTYTSDNCERAEKNESLNYFRIFRPKSTLKDAIIVSQEIVLDEKYRDIMNILESYVFYHQIEILVCKPQGDIYDNDETIILQKFTSMSEMLIIENCDENTEINDNILAVITNRPLTEASKVPTIFYQMPYSYPEDKDDFPNSINLSPKKESLKYSLLQFLKLMKWYRVAVVSDDSEYSQEFADDLIQLFRKDNNFAVTAQMCKESDCNFVQAFETLRDAGAIIIFLNMDSRNAEKVFEMNSHIPEFTWIVRDWPLNFKNKDTLQRLESVFSLNQFSVFRENERVNAPYSAISEGLRIISKFYRLPRYPSIRPLRRDFAQKASQYQRSQEDITRVTLHRGHRAKVVAEIAVKGSDVTVLMYIVDQDNIPSDLSVDCIARSNDYFKQCDHEPILLLMGVLVMFALILLLIVIFFNEYGSQLRYNRLEETSTGRTEVRAPPLPQRPSRASLCARHSAIRASGSRHASTRGSASTRPPKPPLPTPIENPALALDEATYVCFRQDLEPSTTVS